jgi:hypothetical protein
LSSVVVLCAFVLGLLFVGIGGGMVGGLYLCHLLGSLWVIGERRGILLSLIAVFHLMVSR